MVAIRDDSEKTEIFEKQIRKKVLILFGQEEQCNGRIGGDKGE